jgi:hypothetical protein
MSTPVYNLWDTPTLLERALAPPTGPDELLRAQLIYISNRKRDLQRTAARKFHEAMRSLATPQPWRAALKNSKEEAIVKVLSYAQRYARRIEARSSWEGRYEERLLIDCAAFVANNDVNADVFTLNETETCVFLAAVCRELPWFRQEAQSLAKRLEGLDF